MTRTQLVCNISTASLHMGRWTTWVQKNIKSLFIFHACESVGAKCVQNIIIPMESDIIIKFLGDGEVC